MIKHIHAQAQFADKIHQKHLRLKQKHAIVQLHKRFFLIIKLILHIPKHLIQNVFHGDHPAGTTKLIHHNGDVIVIGPHLSQRIVDGLVLRNEIRRLHELLPSKICPRIQMRNQILNIQHPHNHVDRLIINRHPRKTRLTNHRKQLVKINPPLYRRHVNPRPHDLLHLHVAHIYDALQYLLLLLGILLIRGHVNRPREFLRRKLIRLWLGLSLQQSTKLHQQMRKRP